jgi:hypothetical protein
LKLITTKIIIIMNKKFYLTPSLEEEHFRAEQGFALSTTEGGFNGPSYGEEDVEW